MHTLSIRARLMIVFYISVVAAVSIFVLSIYTSFRLTGLGVQEAQRVMLQGEKEKIKVATDSLAQSLGEGLRAIPQESEKVAYLRKAIRNIFFETDKSGYYYIYSGTINVAHPVNPDLQGKDLGGLQGKDGVYSVRELDKAAQAGGGFVDFHWDKPGKGDAPKLGYATRIPGTEYWIGTGVYIDNIDAAAARIDQLLRSQSNKTIVIETIIFLLVFGAILLPLSLWIAKNIVKAIRETTQAAEQIAAGDLDVHLSVVGQNEISLLRQSLNAMVAALKETNASLLQQKEAALQEKEEVTKAMVEAERSKAISEERSHGLVQAADELESVVEILTSASEELSAQIEQSSRGAEEQASRIEGTVASMEEMNATVLEVARNASSAAQNADGTRAKAEEGAGVVKKAVAGIEDIFRQSHAIKDDMGTLGTQAEGIGRIINVISDIADQTNLLALNAAIEAARAGEAGRGFAVVADEVRKLAEKTMAATKEVSEAVQGIQQGTKKNIENVEHSVQTIEEATDLAVQSGKLLEAIVAMVDATTDEVRSIATAAEQQSSASEEINHNVTEVNQLSSENSTAMRQSAEAVVELASQSQRLQALIGKMKSASGRAALA